MLTQRQDLHSIYSWERIFCFNQFVLKSVLEVVVDICPHTDNGMWCPKRPGQTNTFGVTWLVGMPWTVQNHQLDERRGRCLMSLRQAYFIWLLCPAILFSSFYLFASSCCMRSTTTSTLPQFHRSLVPRETLRSVAFTASQSICGNKNDMIGCFTAAFLSC